MARSSACRERQRRSSSCYIRHRGCHGIWREKECLPLAHVPLVSVCRTYQGSFALDKAAVGLLALERQGIAVLREALVARMPVHAHAVGLFQACGQVRTKLVALRQPAQRTTPRIAS